MDPLFVSLADIIGVAGRGFVWGLGGVGGRRQTEQGVEVAAAREVVREVAAVVLVIEFVP